MCCRDRSIRHRRQFITTAGALLSVGAAGCTEDRSYEPGNEGGTHPGDEEATDEQPSEDGTDPIPTPEETPENPPPEGSLTILEHQMVRTDEGTEWETLSVDGRARNDSDQQFGYAEIRVWFYDADETLLDSMIDNVNDLDPGREWQFSVPFLGWGEEAQAVDNYDIAVGTTF